MLLFPYSFSFSPATQKVLSHISDADGIHFKIFACNEEACESCSDQIFINLVLQLRIVILCQLSETQVQMIDVCLLLVVALLLVFNGLKLL